jgi:hypothetical protein
MWCFVDESWHKAANEHVGVLAAVVGPKLDFDELGRLLFRVRKKYYGEDHARDLSSELKGTSLFSNFSFKQQQAGFSKNLLVAREAFEWAATSNIRFVGICVYGDTAPPLLTPNLKSLATPFRELCVRILSHVPDHQNGQLIFDQRLGAQEEISIAVHNYLAGIKENHRLIPNPFVGVSNVWPGLQLADLAAYISANIPAAMPGFSLGIIASPNCRPKGWIIMAAASLAFCVCNGWDMITTLHANYGQKNRAGIFREGRVLRPGRSHSSSCKHYQLRAGNRKPFFNAFLPHSPGPAWTAFLRDGKSWISPTCGNACMALKLMAPFPTSGA